jgi:hypothetical protein
MTPETRLLAELNRGRSGWMVKKTRDADGTEKQIIVRDPDATAWWIEHGTVGRRVGFGVNRADPE